MHTACTLYTGEPTGEHFKSSAKIFEGRKPIIGQTYDSVQRLMPGVFYDVKGRSHNISVMEVSGVIIITPHGPQVGRGDGGQ